MDGKLTKLQARFVEEYMLDLNATQAAGRAGSKAKDLSVAGCEFLANPKVNAEIKRRTEDRSERLKIDADWLLKRLADEATADVSDLYDSTGAILPVQDWPIIWRQGLVAGIEHVEIKDGEGNKTGDVVVKLKLSDRVKRLEMIGKHISVNAFQDVVQHKGLDALADRLARARKREG